ncbi:DNA-binding transcriptional regulator, HxlR family [Saccharopolyspora antimicrobica]|uniref:DNA-binding transcriptional regulator, HxlR family n=1 Tax=Saccharopolyspora antimicrobica TaxID=455193 RepID=A0A1I4VSK1_9PSEU|nr:helix-turn-helix domain-containing protein [Saccharopolyspora antimicrobica]RKT87224.1 HxlR family transcriptional regulator [Saccharopolyspora antimicrobica]SFN04281.1 DNA-binding transcriptional regulator, HxlR family [Saccharopolyspora antimicrobica]
MLGRHYAGQNCPAARTLEVIGERWSLLIVRDAMFAGATRFTDFQRNLGIASNILTKRLRDFVEVGLFELRPGEAGQSEYVLTSKGRDLQPIIIALTAWGDRWSPTAYSPVSYEHEDCGGRVEMKLECTCCGGRSSPAAVKRGPVGIEVPPFDAEPETVESPDSPGTDSAAGDRVDLHLPLSMNPAIPWN